MSLSTKIAAILTVLILSLTAVGGTIQHRAIGSLFSAIEDEEAQRALVRAQNAVQGEIELCSRSAHRVATFEPTRDFVADGGSSEEYLANNLSLSALAGDDLDLLYVCKLDGTVLGGTIRDPLTHKTTKLKSAFPSGKLATSHPATVRFDRDGELVVPAGIIDTGTGTMLIGTAPIQVRDADETDQLAGFVIAGRFLDRDPSKRDTDRTKTFPIDGDRSQLPDDVQEVLDEVTSSASPVVRVRDAGDTLAVYATFDDIRKRPMFLIRTKLERRISAAGKTALVSGGLTDATLGLAILLGLLFTLNRVVIKPLQSLTAHAVETGQSENFRAKFGVERTDEIGTLGTAFDEMMAKLEQARAAVVETARSAGMSEIATGILHNVGNVLNSVNISASLVSQRVDGLCVDDLERLAEVITEHKDDLPRFLESDPRGQHIQPFLSALVVELSQEQESIRSEVQSLTSGIDHICELIKSQQNLAKGSKLIEPADLAERFEEALRMTQRVHGVDNSLVVVRRFENLPEIPLDKHKLLEILVNLVQNARQAMSTNDGPRELILELRRSSNDQVRLAVMDNGIGIESENLVNVFNMGFTTREEGHGFGLHSSANAATEMGGRLWAESEGAGRGARFVLELPASPGSDRPESAAAHADASQTFGGAA